MQSAILSHARSNGANDVARAQRTPISSRTLLTTKQLTAITGLSKSFFDKGRIYGYGPPFIQIGAGKKVGRVFYWQDDVEHWMSVRVCDPEAVR